MAQVKAVAQVQSLAWEPLYTSRPAKKKRKKKMEEPVPDISFLNNRGSRKQEPKNKEENNLQNKFKRFFSELSNSF